MQINKDKSQTILILKNDSTSLDKINSTSLDKINSTSLNKIASVSLDSIGSISPEKIDIIGLTKNTLTETFARHGFTNLDAKKIWPWLYDKKITNIDLITDISKDTRQKLQQIFCINRTKEVSLLKSKDGTQKACLQLHLGQLIETVMIPAEKERNTICISSQVGCCMGCKFCNTGTQGFLRNLSAGEILSQIFFWLEKKIKITNIVFMGMGEPFCNYQNLCDAVEILLHESAFNFSRSRITVSTCGICDKLEEFGEKYKVNLAISLHCANDVVRSEIMQINKAYDLKKVLKIARIYPQISKTDHVTFEYVMLRNVNDTRENAYELIRAVKNIKCKVNLLHFNQWPGCEYKKSEKINEFAQILTENGVMCTVRKSRGDDIFAACGQLKTEVEGGKEKRGLSNI